jgi:hypothetical protein
VKILALRKTKYAVASFYKRIYNGKSFTLEANICRLNVSYIKERYFDEALILQMHVFTWS